MLCAQICYINIEITDLKQLVTLILLTTIRGCANHPDNFRYVCGEYTLLAYRVKQNRKIRYAYKHYFECQVGDQYKKMSPTYLLQPLQNKFSDLAEW